MYIPVYIIQLVISNNACIKKGLTLSIVVSKNLQILISSKKIFKFYNIQIRLIVF